MAATKSQTQIETTLVATLKKMAVRKGLGMLKDGWSPASVVASLLTSKVVSLHLGKAEKSLIRMGYDARVARKIANDCAEVASNEAAIELGI